MNDVHLLESVSSAEQCHVGATSDLKRRVADHNTGQSRHTAKFALWLLVTYIAISNADKARAFERYIKLGSGHASAQ